MLKTSLWTFFWMCCNDWCSGLNTSWLPCIFTVIKISFPFMKNELLRGKDERMINWGSFFCSPFSPSNHSLPSSFLDETIFYSFSFKSACHEIFLWLCYWIECQKDSRRINRLNAESVNDKSITCESINPLFFHSFSSASPFQPFRYHRWKVASPTERTIKKLHATKKQVLRLLVFDQNIPGKSFLKCLTILITYLIRESDCG